MTVPNQKATTSPSCAPFGLFVISGIPILSFHTTTWHRCTTVESPELGSLLLCLWISAQIHKSQGVFRLSNSFDWHVGVVQWEPHGIYPWIYLLENLDDCLENDHVHCLVGDCYILLPLPSWSILQKRLFFSRSFSLPSFPNIIWIYGVKTPPVPPPPGNTGLTKRLLTSIVPW